MFVDASALTAMMLDEPDAEEMARAIASARAFTSPLAIWETVVAVARETRRQPREVGETAVALLSELQVEIVAVLPETTLIAVDAFERYGKGRHPAGLNFGDCFAYACARNLGVSLLFKGEDFTHTDIEPAGGID